MSIRAHPAAQRAIAAGLALGTAGAAESFEPLCTTKPTGSGTGLGLSLSFDIVTQAHSGRLEFESRLGEGTTFTVILPARQ